MKVSGLIERRIKTLVSIYIPQIRKETIDNIKDIVFNIIP